MKISALVLLFYQCLYASFAEAKDDHPTEILTVAQRIELFGTNCSVNLPDYEIVTLRRLDVSQVRQHSVHQRTERYEIGYRNETMNFTLINDENILSPGCMIHHYSRGKPKIIYPCNRSLAECFYTGFSDTHNGSWITANTCHGVKGLLTIKGSTLIIAPLDKQELQGDDSDKLHVVYHYNKTLPPSDSTITVAEDDIVPDFGYIHRQTRNLGSPIYIETRIAVDPLVNKYHGNKPENYVQTIFNMASRLFEDKSLGLDVRLCLAELHIYDDYDKIGVKLDHDANKTLQSFCEWIAKNTTTETDATLLLTKIDMQFQHLSSTVGLANQGAMCKRYSSCMLVQDVGLSSGAIIAHEMGHLFGMAHINNTKCKGQKGIMGVGDTGPETFRWTNCSAEVARNFLSTTQAQCLRNKPLGTNASAGFDQDAPLPGTVYTRNEQCKLVFGSQSHVCSDPDMGVCEVLSCLNANGDCVRSQSNVVDGTDCNNTRSWCISGKCQAMSPSHSAPPVNGGWTQWQTLECTKQCEGGVKLSRRKCENPPPQYGGKTCVGEVIRARLCSLESCLEDHKTDRCQEEADKRHIPGKWIKDMNSRSYHDECSWLICRDRSNRNYLPKVFPVKMDDGTKCDIGTRAQYGRCVEGKCKSFGCDGIMDSDKVYDKCGICNGTGKMCQLFTNSYSQNALPKVFTRVIVVPKGSYSVKVTQGNFRSCYLGAVMNGKTLFSPMVSRSDVIDGVRFKYTRLPESLEIEGPTPADIEILVYRSLDYRNYSNAAPDIHYEYYRKPDVDFSNYHWQVKKMPCSRSCGLGYITQVVKCVDLSSKPVADSLCDIGTKPSEASQVCSDFKCPTTWNAPGFGECSVTCGHGGIRKRPVQCSSYYNDTYKVYLEIRCASTPKPAVEQQCTFVPCPPEWRIGQWSECSKSCSKGYQNRPVECFYVNGTRADPYECKSNKPLPTQDCFKGPCPNMPYGNGCKDNTNCSSYEGGDLCYGYYHVFAKNYCSKHCEYCSTDDDPGCSRNVCVSKKDWAAINCPKLCKECDDDYHCQTVMEEHRDIDICKDDIYRNFTNQHCRKTCGLCGECIDHSKTPCWKYGHAACANETYLPYMQANCAKFCGFC